MANYIGGDIVEIVCNHPSLGDFRFSPKANESFTLTREELLIMMMKAE